MGSAGEERIKPVPDCLLEQQKFVFCYFSSCCLVIRLREAVSSVQETGSEEGCLNLSVPSEKSQSLISFRKELLPLSPSTCYLQHSQFCTAYNHNPGAIVFHPGLPGAFRSLEKQGNCRQSFPPSARRKDVATQALWVSGNFSPSAAIQGRRRTLSNAAGWKKWHPQLVILGGQRRSGKLKKRDRHMCTK